MRLYNSSMVKAAICAIFILLGAALSPAFAQQKTVSGTVLDETNQPMIGVSVIEKGTTNGITTDIDGKWALAVAANATLEISFIGYETLTYPASAVPATIQMTPDAVMLEETVVVGYGVQKKSDVTGAIAQVKTEDIQNRSIANAQSALQGKTSGVQIIQTSARPGASPTIRVRGYSSNASSDPLYVVDGVRVGSIDGIDPNDIASMEILKDAASAAIYGAEAGNGVVLITTKRGKAGEGKISYDFQIVSQSLAHTPKMLNSEEFINYMVEGGYATLESLLSTWDGKTNTSWLDVAFENSLMHKHNLSFQNGNEKGNYYLSLSYLDNNGIVKGKSDIYKRLTASINAEYKIKNWFKVGTTNQIEKYDSRSISENNEYGSMVSAMLLLDPLTPDTYKYEDLPYEMLKEINDGKTFLKNEKGEYYSVSKYFAGENYHPMIMRDNNISTAGGFNVNGSIFADFTPFKGFTFTSRFGYRLSGQHSSSTSLPFYGNSKQNRDFVDHNESSSTSIYYQWENFANYNHMFKGGHNFNAMIGMSFQEYKSSYVNGGLSANGEHAVMKNDPLFYYLNYANKSAVKTVGGETSMSAKYSWFGRVNYDYKGRYMIQASLRADAADLAKLPITKRWGFFPAVSAGWQISEEPFFAPAKNVVNNLKLRFSWGQNGSLSALSGYMYSTDMGSNGFYPFVSGNEYLNGTAPNSMGNDELKWETSEQFDVGIDARFLGNRLTFGFDFFNKQTKDLLVMGATPDLILGGTASPINAGNVLNRGVEIDLGWTDSVGDFRYSVRGNISTLKNEVTYLHPTIERLGGARFHTSTITYFEKGYPVYYFRGYRFEGIDKATGEPIIPDLNGDGQYNEKDTEYIGDAIPKLTYGLTLNLSWKGIDFMVFGTGSYGNKIFCCMKRPDYPASNVMKDVFYTDRWTASNPNGSVPKSGAQNMDKYLLSSAMIFDGSFFKIKQIQLGYTFPSKWMNKAKINNFRIYASLDDFFTFTKYPGFDPEVATNSTSGMGVDKGAYPSSKKVVFGLNLTF